ncbi:MAG: hypothetical protein OEZ34_01460 [Spirochaetia bacterium]|nr:hypothetical protein [Spirochaetia bacterium]
MIWVVLGIAIVLGAFGQIFMKEAMKLAGPVPIDQSIKEIGFYFIYSLLSVKMFFAVVCYGMSFVLWLGVLAEEDLSLIRPMMSAGYLITLFYGFYAGENVTMDRLAGTLLIIAGIYFLTKSALPES